MDYSNKLKNVVTIAQHVLAKQKKHPDASGDFSSLMLGIALASKVISSKIRRAGYVDIIGKTGDVNIQGENVQKLDDYANEVLISTLKYRSDIALLASEEMDEPLILNENGKYAVFFDPLDGSSNIDVNVSVGTIFSVLSLPKNDLPIKEKYLMAGSKQLAAGYILYGSSTVLVYTTGDGVDMFTLDPAVGAYRLVKENLQIPKKGTYYCVPEGNSKSFKENIIKWLEYIKNTEKYSSRYVGTFVADFHRTLLKGGIYVYPETNKTQDGKLRLMYEVNPLAFIIEQAGGLAMDGESNILERVPKELHERTAVVIGSKEDVKKYFEF